MTNPKATSPLSLALTKALSDCNTNPTKLAAKIGFVSDHVRKVCKGDVMPSVRMLNKICEELNLDPTAMLALLKAEKAKQVLD